MDAASVDRIQGRSYSSRPRFDKKPGPKASNHTQQKQKCYACGSIYCTVKAMCKAKGKTCGNCGKPNHFSAMCHAPKKNLNQVTSCSVADANERANEALLWAQREGPRQQSPVFQNSVCTRAADWAQEVEEDNPLYGDITFDILSISSKERQ
jgi:hypothetical protein